MSKSMTAKELCSLKEGGMVRMRTIESFRKDPDVKIDYRIETDNVREILYTGAADPSMERLGEEVLLHHHDFLGRSARIVTVDRGDDTLYLEFDAKEYGSDSNRTYWVNAWCLFPDYVEHESAPEKIKSFKKRIWL